MKTFCAHGSPINLYIITGYLFSSEFLQNGCDLWERQVKIAD
jgi:hypothetical protein